MNRQESALKKLRPSLNLGNFSTTKPMEQFQNEVLRPIIKQQHEVLKLIWENDHYFKLSTTSATTRSNYHLSVMHWLQHNTSTRSVLLGCIIGMMTIDELNQYRENQRELNKRMVSTIAQRITDSKFGKLTVN